LFFARELLLELVPLLEPEWLMPPFRPGRVWSGELPADPLVERLESVDCPVLGLEVLLCAIPRAPAANNTQRISGNLFMAVSLESRAIAQ
jgi:hypothetical protein